MTGTGKNISKFVIAVTFVVAMTFVYQVSLRRYGTVIKGKPLPPFKAATPAKVLIGTKHKSKQHNSSSRQTMRLGQNNPQKTVATMASVSSSSGSHPCDLSRYSNPFPPVFKTNDVFLVDYMVKYGYKATLGAGIRRETLDPLEEPLFRLPIADDALCLPEELESQVHLIDPRDRYTVGDKIRFRVDLYTGYGTQRRSGGDDVRMWLQSAVGKWSMVAAVTDLGNGSYFGDAVLKWSGVTLVKVSLTYPREYLRSLVEVYHTIHSLRWIPSAYRRHGKKTEKTMCFPFAPVPGFDKWCNFTSANGNRTWFCAHPVSEDMKCSDRSDIINMPYLDLRHSPIRHAVKPFADKLSQCMRHTTLLLLGDSNQRQFFEKILTKLPGCTHDYQGKGGWHAPRVCTDKEHNFTLMTAAHSLPFHGGTHGDLLTVPLPQALDRILTFSSSSSASSSPSSSSFPPSSSSSSSSSSSPSNPKTVLVLHYYRHFLAFSVQVYRQRVREARRTLETWVQLHPEVTIFIRGAHAVYRYNDNKQRVTIGDAGVQLYAQVWREEFVGLRDRVRFLDMWDLSVAARNLESHPQNPQGMEMVKVLLGYMCQGDTD